MEPTATSAVEQSLAILGRHYQLFGSKRQRGWGISLAEPDIARVRAAFDAAGAQWVVAGAHAVGLLTEARATIDFDFIVEARRLKAILDELRATFGDLQENDIGAAVRLLAIDVDLIRSTNHPLFAEALARAQVDGPWRVPTAEVVIALKFLAAVSPWRNRNKKVYDVADLQRVYLDCDVDRAEVLRLGAMVYPGAEAELERMLDRIDRGEPLTI